MTSKRASAAASELSRLAHKAMTVEQRKARAKKAADRRWAIYKELKAAEVVDEKTS